MCKIVSKNLIIGILYFRLVLAGGTWVIISLQLRQYDNEFNTEYNGTDN